MTPDAVVRTAVIDARSLYFESEITSVLEILNISRSSWYKRTRTLSGDGRRGPAPKAIPREVCKQVVAFAQDNPWYGYKRIAVIARRTKLSVSDRQVYRIMKENKLLHLRKRKKIGELHEASKLYELLPKAPNELFQMDVTYIHIPGHGWWYATTVIDYYSRYLLALHLTPGYAASDCIEALEGAIGTAEKMHGKLKRPAILVTDNGSSFTSRRFQRTIKDMSLGHVRIRYRTPTQLGLLERFHRTLKHEEVYWNLYENPAHARDCLEIFQKRYNTFRPHWALRPGPGIDPVTPEDVYRNRVRPTIPKWQKWATEAKAKIEKELRVS